MHSRFDQFQKTGLGRQLTALFDSPYRYAEFAALARAGVASIAAICLEVERKFPEAAANATARQFCGAMVAEVMRSRGHEILQARGRVRSTVFSYGAVFSPEPVTLSYAAMISKLSAMPDAMRRYLDTTPEAAVRTRPNGTGFSMVEHICHLRDLDAVYASRISAVLGKNLPMLESVDGTVMARERAYLKQDARKALTQFVRSRKNLCTQLKSIGASARKRCGLRDGVKRMSIDDLVIEAGGHDAEHIHEIEELLPEISSARPRRAGAAARP